jgi:hypothetical protein
MELKHQREIEAGEAAIRAIIQVPLQHEKKLN